MVGGDPQLAKLAYNGTDYIGFMDFMGHIKYLL